MSLTLSMVAADSTFPIGHPYSRCNTISTASDGTIRHHSRPHGSNESFRVSPTLLKENEAPIQPRALATAALRDSMALSRHDDCNQPLPSTEQDLQRPSAVASAQLHNSSRETFQTVPLGSRSPSPFEDFSSITHPEDDSPDMVTLQQDPLLEQDSSNSAPAPFRRWLDKLRHHALPGESEGDAYDLLIGSLSNEHDISAHRKSESSRGIISAVRTATMTLAETSMAPRTWLETRLSHLRRSGNTSHDSLTVGPVMDEAAWCRAVQRRKILEELIESEESYVADLKVLSNVYFTLLASVSALSSQARSLVRENISEILQMHETLLGELYTTVPHSEYSRSHAAEPPVYHPKGHVRWHSADSGIGLGKLKDLRLARRFRHSIDMARIPKQSTVGSVADPSTAAGVAKVFEKFMPQLFAYEEYGAKYELIVRDLASTYKTLNTEQAFERGIEILSRTVESINARNDGGRKGLTFADLVIKPIQRVCRYPLLFGDLAKHTPIVDDPQAHADVEKVLFRLKEATREINRATDDPSTRALIEKTWLLQDRLRYTDQTGPAVRESRLLGHVLLCGVLHVAYHSRLGIMGKYMLCALFKAFLLLAVPRKGTSMFDIVATIPVMNISIESTDNGRGLQCHTAQYSWKVIFQADYRLFELIMSACSPVEEAQWMKQLNERSCIESLDSTQATNSAQDSCSSLALEIIPLGTLYGQPNTLARRMSIHRAATLGPRTQMNQVIIKHTESVEHSPHVSSTSSLPISRSRSMASTNQIRILAPKRVERVNMEASLSDVWTRDSLPYPGMRAENSLKASASHVMRKLSMASLTSTFSRRSSIHGSVPRMPQPEIVMPRAATAPEVDASGVRSKQLKAQGKGLVEHEVVRKPHNRPAVAVNFHKTPEMFLPPDFELKDPRAGKMPRKKVAIRAVSDDEDRVKKVGHNGKRPDRQFHENLDERVSAKKQPAMRVAPMTPLTPLQSNHKVPTAKLHRKSSADVQKASKPLSSHLRKLWA